MTKPVNSTSTSSTDPIQAVLQDPALTRIVAKHLPRPALQALVLTSKTMYQRVQETLLYQKSKLVMEAKVLAGTLPLDEQDEDLINIAVIEALNDTTSTYANITQLPNHCQDKALIGIAMAQVKLKNYDAAAATLARVTSHLVYQQKFLDLAEVYIKCKNYTAAFGILNSLPSSESKDTVLMCWCRSSPALFSMAHQIQAPQRRARMLEQTALLQPENFTLALAQALSEPTTAEKDRLLKHIVGIQVQSKQFDRALEAACRIDCHDNKQRALLSIVKGQVQLKQFDPALTVAQQIENPYTKVLAFVAIEKDKDQPDFTEAYEVARQITCFNNKARAFLEIEKNQAYPNFTAALQAVQQITDPHTRDIIRIDIAKHQARDCLIAAKITAEQCVDVSLRIDALLEIAQNLSDRAILRMPPSA